MDKKKVEELMEQIRRHLFLLGNHSNNDCRSVRIVRSCLDDLDEELSKSVWVSVEDGLPEYDKSVLVCNEKEPSDIWFAHRTADRNVIVDEHEFAKGYGEITHWQRIKELGK